MRTENFSSCLPMVVPLILSNFGGHSLVAQAEAGLQWERPAGILAWELGSGHSGEAERAMGGRGKCFPKAGASSSLKEAGSQRKPVLNKPLQLQQGKKLLAG